MQHLFTAVVSMDTASAFVATGYTGHLLNLSNDKYDSAQEVTQDWWTHQCTKVAQTQYPVA